MRHTFENLEQDYCIVCDCPAHEMATDCPGYVIMDWTRLKISEDKLDFKRGRWVKK